MEVAKEGFKNLIRPDMVSEADPSVSAKSIPNASWRFTVTATAPIVNTEAGMVSTVVDRTFVEDLPLTVRSTERKSDRRLPGVVRIGV